MNKQKLQDQVARIITINFATCTETELVNRVIDYVEANNGRQICPNIYIFATRCIMDEQETLRCR